MPKHADARPATKPPKKSSGGCCGGGGEGGGAAPPPASPARVNPEGDPASDTSPALPGAPKDAVGFQPDTVEESREALPEVSPHPVTDAAAPAETDNPAMGSGTGESPPAAAAAFPPAPPRPAKRVLDSDAEDIEEDIIQGHRKPSNATTQTFNSFITSFAPSGRVEPAAGGGDTEEAAPSEAPSEDDVTEFIRRSSVTGSPKHRPVHRSPQSWEDAEDEVEAAAKAATTDPRLAMRLDSIGLGGDTIPRQPTSDIVTRSRALSETPLGQRIMAQQSAQASDGAPAPPPSDQA